MISLPARFPILVGGRPFRRSALLLLAMIATQCVIGCGGGGEAFSPRSSVVESDPAGASVFVDGGFVGTTPAEFHLPARDRVSVRVELPGYAPIDETLVRDARARPDSRPGTGWEAVYYYKLVKREMR